MFEQRDVIFKCAGKIDVVPVICILPLVVYETKDMFDRLIVFVWRIHLTSFAFLFDNFHYWGTIKNPTRSSMT